MYEVDWVRKLAEKLKRGMEEHPPHKGKRLCAKVVSAGQHAAERDGPDEKRSAVSGEGQGGKGEKYSHNQQV